MGFLAKFERAFSRSGQNRLDGKVEGSVMGNLLRHIQLQGISVEDAQQLLEQPKLIHDLVEVGRKAHEKKGVRTSIIHYPGVMGIALQIYFNLKRAQER